MTEKFKKNHTSIPKSPPFKSNHSRYSSRKGTKKEIHDKRMQNQLLMIAALLSFSSLVAYIITRDAHVLDSAFTSPLLIVVGYWFGNQRR
jgi:hypothetical protein